MSGAHDLLFLEPDPQIREQEDPGWEHGMGAWDTPTYVQNLSLETLQESSRVEVCAPVNRRWGRFC